MSEIPASWLRTALAVTGHFEDSRDPLAAVTGDFDGMGVSLGVLQWNIGSGSLQPLVKKLGREATLAAAPGCGAELWEACTAPIPRGLAIVRGWQRGARLAAEVVTELKALARSDGFVEVQMAACSGVAESALADAQRWAAAVKEGGQPDKAVFCWFFDVWTQNGGLKGLSHADVGAFIAQHGGDNADNVVCDWLAARVSSEAGYKDSRRNAELWLDKVPADRLPLLTMSYLRALKSRPEYRGDVLNRKGAIAVGRGWVHAELHDLEPLLYSA